jgi:bifunctional polynucleotide phosphatase/kinase
MSPTIVKTKGFRFRMKLAAFDYDWTIIRPNSDGEFPKNKDDWKWLRPNVPSVLKSLYDKGFCIVLFTNQTKRWKGEQIETVVKSLEIPVLACIAFDKAEHKPSTAMYDGLFAGKKVDNTKSFFVGDALGRQNDWSNTDKLFAQAVNLKVITPEEMFGAEEPLPIKLPMLETTSAQELVVMVGFPGSGKSYWADKVFGANKDYTVLHGDELKTSAKLQSAALKCLKNGQSVVIDATNPSRKKRSEYITIANTLNVPTRCVHVATSMGDSMYRNNNRPKETQVPKIVYYVFNKHFEMPVKEEGFVDIVTIQQ